MKLIDFFFAARPLLHLPIWSVYLISLTYHLDLTGEQFQWIDLLNLLLLSTMVAGAYFINQVHDARSDELNDKLGFIQKGFINIGEFRIVFLLCSLLALVISWLVTMTTLFLFAQFFLLGYFYSVPPLKLKDRPWLGLVVNAYSFGWLVPLVVMSELSMHNGAMLAIDLSLYFFFTVAAVHVLTTVPDRDGDNATGKKTIANICQPVTVRLVAVVLLLLSLATAAAFGRTLLIALSVSACLAIIPALIKPDLKYILLAAKLPILLLTLAAGYYYPFYLMFILALFLLTRIYYARRFGIIYPRLI